MITIFESDWSHANFSKRVLGINFQIYYCVHI